MPPTADDGPEPPARRPRIGAYLLAADPTWITSSIARYYDLLDDLVVVAADDGTGWTGAPIEADRCVELVRSVDTRGIARELRGRWRDSVEPLRAETAQRQTALDALRGMDWVIQLDPDELLPEPGPLLAAMTVADGIGVDAIEWPMRVLFRRRRNGSYLEVTDGDGRQHFEYPGPVVVRPGVTLTEARHTGGRVLRMVVHGDRSSTQVAAACAPGEIRLDDLPAAHAIVHNSWAREPRVVRRKLASWGHAGGWRLRGYFVVCWWPAPVTWRALRNFHPLFSSLWPRLAPTHVEVSALLRPADLRP